MLAFYGSRNCVRQRFSCMQRKQRLIDSLIEKLVPIKHIHETVVIVGSACFATTFRNSRATPVAMLIKELAKRRRVLLMDEYFTTQMCSGCNIHLPGRKDTSCEVHMSCEHAIPIRKYYKLRSVESRPPSSTSNKRNVKKQLAPSPASKTTPHSAICMPSFIRIPLKPPDPRDPPLEQGKHTSHTYTSIVHGLKQCVHCGRYWNRDVSAARNIGWCFLSLCLTGQRPPHLRRPISKKQRVLPSLTLDTANASTTVIPTTFAKGKVMVKSR
mmetsp:Transcript_1004/g.1425  ORF Transcript_1004/g.1425 Transcript_1004/m.1425 type:complete len:270 (-) Transcript_1004:9-818(-)